ncbi:DUF3504 domain containing protein, partial [Asbolus verrucosus]
NKAQEPDTNGKFVITKCSVEELHVCFQCKIRPLRTELVTENQCTELHRPPNRPPVRETLQRLPVHQQHRLQSHLARDGFLQRRLLTYSLQSCFSSTDSPVSVKRQRELGPVCLNCTTAVSLEALGRFSARFGGDIRQFCSSSCLIQHKNKFKSCSYCLQDVSRKFLQIFSGSERFCSQRCEDDFRRLKKGPPVANVEDVACSVCHQVGPSLLKYEAYGSPPSDFCSEKCLGNYFAMYNVETAKCCNCCKFTPKEYLKQHTVFHKCLLYVFCSPICRNLFINDNREVVDCPRCGVKKFTRDTVKKFQSLATVEASLCFYCYCFKPEMFSFPTSDGGNQYFCSIECLDAFIHNKANTNPPIVTGDQENNLLELDVDELNVSLGRFVQEVKSPDGTEYTTDTIYYLCLGIQKYLIDNGRNDNIFQDSEYQYFNSCLDRLTSTFQLPLELSSFKIEENHLWETRQLGIYSPRVLTFTLIFFFTKYFKLLFCSSSINGGISVQHQQELGSVCLCCIKAVPLEALGKFCARFGGDIRPFCSISCLIQHRRRFNPCAYCLQDLSRKPRHVLKGSDRFCTHQCLQSFSSIKEGPLVANVEAIACRICHQVGQFLLKYVSDGFPPSDFCSEKCFEDYSSKYNVDSAKCCYCLKFTPKQYLKQYTVFHKCMLYIFCSAICRNLFIHNHNDMVQCSRCNIRKFSRDTVKKIQNSATTEACSLSSLCNYCQYYKPQMFSFPKSDGNNHYFCSLVCLEAFTHNAVTELLGLDADEFNVSLGQFVQEVGSPHGMEYAIDTIYYLCLGLQKYLMEIGRKDNIFHDSEYQYFHKCLDRLASTFQIPPELSSFKVEENHLWETKQLGTYSPQVLTFTLIFFFAKYFKLLTVQNHLELSLKQIAEEFMGRDCTPEMITVKLSSF